MANRPRAAPTETLTAMLAAAPVVLGDGAASVAFTSESEPDSVGEAESEPESEPEPVPVPAVNCISAFLCINGVWEVTHCQLAWRWNRQWCCHRRRLAGGQQSGSSRCTPCRPSCRQPCRHPWGRRPGSHRWGSRSWRAAGTWRGSRCRCLGLRAC